jgi:hypothetical protein
LEPLLQAVNPCAIEAHLNLPLITVPVAHRLQLHLELSDFIVILVVPALLLILLFPSMEVCAGGHKRRFRVRLLLFFVKLLFLLVFLLLLGCTRRLFPDGLRATINRGGALLLLGLRLSTLFNEAHNVIKLHVSEMILLFGPLLLFDSGRHRGQECEGFWHLLENGRPAVLAELVEADAVVLFCLLISLLLFGLPAAGRGPELPEAKFDNIDLVAPALNVIGVPLRAAWGPLKFDADLPGIQIELIANIEMLLLLNLEVFVEMESALVRFLEVLDVDPRALLIVLEVLDASQKFLDAQLFCLCDARSLLQVRLRMRQKRDEIGLSGGVKVRLQQVGMHIFENRNRGVLWVL